jgi:23S rRNA pseudouridine1911/1915/1917 synthase
LDFDQAHMGDQASLLEIQIETGRPDQIRIHLAAVGQPLVGDPFYGAGGVPLPDGRALPGDGGYLLHATRLEFPHPRTGMRTIVECPPPPGLRL